MIQNWSKKMKKDKQFCLAYVYGKPGTEFSEYLISKGHIERPTIHYDYIKQGIYENCSIYHVYCIISGFAELPEELTPCAKEEFDKCLFTNCKVCNDSIFQLSEDEIPVLLDLQYCKNCIDAVNIINFGKYSGTQFREINDMEYLNCLFNGGYHNKYLLKLGLTKNSYHYDMVIDNGDYVNCSLMRVSEEFPGGAIANILLKIFRYRRFLRQFETIVDIETVVTKLSNYVCTNGKSFKYKAFTKLYTSEFIIESLRERRSWLMKYGYFVEYILHVNCFCNIDPNLKFKCFDIYTAVNLYNNCRDFLQY